MPSRTIRQRFTLAGAPAAGAVLTLEEPASKLEALTAEIVTAAGTTPEVSFRLTDRTRGNDVLYDTELFTDGQFAANVAGRRVGWISERERRIDWRTTGVRMYVRDADTAVYDLVMRVDN